MIKKPSTRTARSGFFAESTMGSPQISCVVIAITIVAPVAIQNCILARLSLSITEL